jgi:hypothetical protein
MQGSLVIAEGKNILLYLDATLDLVLRPYGNIVNLLVRIRVDGWYIQIHRLNGSNNAGMDLFF